MKKQNHWWGLLLGGLLLGSGGMAQATILDASMTTDDSFTAYVSTSSSTLGTAFLSGTFWGTVYAGSATLTPGQNYWLNILAYDGQSPGGTIGQFTIGDTNFLFANGTSTLLTNTTNWLGALYNGSSWVAPTGSVVSYGANGVSPWGTRSGIDSNADWIWPTAGTTSSGAACANCTVELQAEIIAQSSLPPPTGVPEPGELWLMGMAMAAAGFAAQRRLALR